jgi:regulatory protein YycI of two-component signal transduction system YycFG
MDLSRAKTVLICAFFLLNVFLGYQIWQDGGLGAWKLLEQKGDMLRLEKALQDANLKLETALPRNDKSLSHLIVEPWNAQTEEIIATFWGYLEGKQGDPTVWQKYENADNGNSQAVYRFQEYELSIRKEGAMTLKILGDEKKDHAAPEVLKTTTQKLVDNISFLNVFIFDYLKKTDQGLVVSYRQEYEGYPLYAGYLQMAEDDEGKMVLFLYRLTPLAFAEQKREIIPPSRALLRFLEGYGAGKEETSIVEISLGYYSREYDAQRWEIPPVWRICLSSGEIYYINSFTGHLEN